MLELGFFYMFAGLAVISALAVVLSRNSVHAVMSLILCFFNAAGLFFLLDAEFVGIILILVYVGAVMVLFMFVVMLLEVNFVNMREGMLKYLPIGGVVALVLFAEIIATASSGVFSPEGIPNPGHVAQQINNTVEIGKMLYTKYLLGFEIAAIVLLVALVGAIVLTLRVRTDVKYQNISKQVNVNPADRMHKVKM